MMENSALKRVIRTAAPRRGEPVEHCDVCSEQVPEQHRHLLDTDTGELMCTCQACSLLFDRDAASNGHYRRVPERRLRLQSVPTEKLGVPVGLAFFVPRGDGTVLAHYPSPAGPTQWDVDRQAWDEVAEACPELGEMCHDVEALLVNTTAEARQQWIVGIDDCYRLVGVVRQNWKGLSGGGTVWPEIRRFFAGLDEQR